MLQGPREADADALLTVRDAAARLGVCTATVYTLCERVEIPHVRVLNAIRIAAGDLAAFVEANKTRAARGASKPPAIRPATRQLQASGNQRSDS